MGIITALPITTTSIPELPVYGSVNEDAATKDLIEITKNTGSSGMPIYDTGGSRRIPLDEFKLLAGGKPRFFEKYDKYDLVISSMVGGVDYYYNFTITPAMQGYYLQMHLDGADASDRQIYSNNIAFKFNFTGTFPDGFCIRIQPLTLGGSKCNLFDYYLTSGKAYDFVYDLELDHWAVDELQNVCHKSSTYLPLYNPDSLGNDLYLTNSNHTYIFRIGNNTLTTKGFYLPPTALWRGRKITIYIDKDVPNAKSFGPFFYPTPYALATGVNAYSAVFTPVITAFRDKIIWIKFPANSTGLVTIDAGFGAKKAYNASLVQLGSGDIIGGFYWPVYQFHYDVNLDPVNIPSGSILLGVTYEVTGVGTIIYDGNTYNVGQIFTGTATTTYATTGASVIQRQGGWVLDNDTVPQPDTIEGELSWRFPFGTSGVKRGSYVVFEADYNSIKISDMNIII